MVAHFCLLYLGLPLIVYLAIRAWRQFRAITTRMEAVQEEMARNPQIMAQALGEIFAARKTDRAKKGRHG